MPRQEKARPKNDYIAPTTPFDGSSRYRSDFPMHGRTPRESFKPIENTVKSDAPFEGMTEARKSYVQHTWPYQVNAEYTPGYADHSLLGSTGHQEHLIKIFTYLLTYIHSYILSYLLIYLLTVQVMLTIV